MSLTKVTYSMISGAPANVFDYGAKGDGIANDTAAIQAAMAANLSVSFGDISNTFNISGTLTLRSGQYLFSNGATLKKVATMATPMISGIGISDAKIEGFNIDGNYTIQVASIPTIYLESAESVVLSRLNCINMGCISYITDLGSLTIYKSSNILLTDSSWNITNGMNSIHVYGIPSNNVCIQNNYIKNSYSDSGISVTESMYCKVIGNYVEIAAGSLISFNGTYGTVSGNTVVASSALVFNGITLGHITAGGSAAFTTCTENKVKLFGFGDTGISIQAGERIIVANNFIYGTNGGVYCATADAIISGNNITGGSTGVSLTALAINTIVANNLIDQFTDWGVFSFSSCSINGNRIISHIVGAAVGIQLNAANNVVTGNNIVVPGTPVIPGYSSAVDGGTVFRGNLIGTDLCSEQIIIPAATTTVVYYNSNIVAGGVVYLMPLNVYFPLRLAGITSITNGSLTITCTATANDATCRVVIL